MKLISYVSIGFIFLIVALSLLNTHAYATSSNCTVRGQGVDLSGCNLAGANLGYDDFTNANFTNANLTGANFSSTNLTNTNFTGANLTGVQWFSTTCPDGTVSDVQCAVLYVAPAPAAAALTPQKNGVPLLGTTQVAVI